MTIATPTLADPCPHCQTRLVTDGDATPWCGRCLWNIDAFELDTSEKWLARRLRRIMHHAGYDLGISLYRALSGGRVERPAIGSATILLAAISGVLLAAILGLAVGGVWLLIEGTLPLKVLGGVMVLCAIGLRPRLGSLKHVADEYDELTLSTAPQLFALIGEVAAACGARRPHTVMISPQWNASTGVYGLRRRRVLMLGLPLWTVLRPQERVALLAHELGHFANGDPRTQLVTAPAMQTFGLLAHILYPIRHDPLEPDEDLDGSAARMGRMIVQPILTVLAVLCHLADIGLNMIGARHSQRAEYYADRLSAEVAGTSAVLGLHDVACVPGLVTVIGARSRSGQRADGWREGVAVAREKLRDRMPLIRQLTLRTESSILASHPPTGLRHGIVAEAAHHDPKIVLTPARAAAIDAELSKYEERYRRVIAESW